MVVDTSVISPILIGRENDLQVLDRLRLQAFNRTGQIALISGEAGIGKSRLLQETKSRVPTHAKILEGHCFQTESALPYAPFLDLFRNFLATHTRAEIIRAMDSSAAHLIKLLPELNRYFSNLNASPSTDAREEKQRLFQALTQSLTALAQAQPLIIVIEDVHWSDATSLEFLLSLTRRISTLPILLLLTYRSDATTPDLTHFLAELDRTRLGTEIALKPLDASDVDAMLRAILNLDTVVSNEFLDLILPLTEGNPFFIEEILKAMIADGDIFYANNKWDRKEISQLRVPRTVQAAVQQRTQQLDQNTINALTLAAVMGRRFDFDILRLLLGVQEVELTAMLKELVKAQLVVEESANKFAFRHALTREAIYSSLLLRERSTMHRAVAEAIERKHTHAMHTHPADLSYHFYTGGVWDKALTYSHQAAIEACDLYAQREAIIYYSRALVAARELNIEIDPKLLRDRGHAYEILGDFNSALDDFEQALLLAQESQNGRDEWQTLMDIGFLWAGRDYQRTGEYFRRAEVQAQKLNQPKLHAQTLNRLGNLYINIGQMEQGMQAHMQALEIFENEQDEQGMAETCDLLGMATLQRGDQVGAHAEYQQAIRLFRKLDDKRGLISALTVASIATCWDETDRIPPYLPEENQKLAMEGLDLAHQIDWKAGQAFAEWCLALNLAHRGVFGEALAHANEALQIATEIEHRQWIIGAHYALGQSYVQMQQADRAIQNVEKGLLLASELGSAWWIGNLTVTLANAYLLKGDLDHARALLESASLKETGFYTLVERRMLRTKGQLFLAENKPAQALEISERLLEAVIGKDQTKPIPALLELKAEAEMALKQWKKAEQDLEQAKQVAEHNQILPLLWQIHRSLGQLHKKQKNNDAAEKEFITARQVVQQMAANIGDEKLQAEFIRSAERSLPRESKIAKRRSAAEKFGGLTPREREVARLLSTGKSNREIAEGLFLSERTVENHVGNILTKLGFDSRAQVAVWALEKGFGKQDAEIS